MMVTMNFIKVVTVFLSLSSVYAAKDEDLVTSLPGYQGELPSKHYSGYMHTGDLSGQSGQLHYWFIESQNDPANDPGTLHLFFSSFINIYIYVDSFID